MSSRLQTHVAWDWATLCQSQLYPPVRDFGFGLKIIIDRDEHSVYIQVIHHQPNLCPSFERKMIINLKKRKEVPQMTRRMVNQWSFSGQIEDIRDDGLQVHQKLVGHPWMEVNTITSLHPRCHMIQRNPYTVFYMRSYITVHSYIT